MTYYLCDAGIKLRSQIDHRWPHRDTASDGWIGDASHSAAVSDHNPDWDSTPPGCVRAIDVDANLSKGDPDAMDRLAGQLAASKDDRLSYIIWDRRMWRSYAHENIPRFTWAPYTGTDDPHTSHMHVSFNGRGDDHPRPFTLPIFSAPKRERLRALIDKLTGRLRKARRELERAKP